MDPGLQTKPYQWGLSIAGNSKEWFLVNLYIKTDRGAYAGPKIHMKQIFSAQNKWSVMPSGDLARSKISKNVKSAVLFYSIRALLPYTGRECTFLDL